ncbi:hypothetical protein PV05_05310 [Exophiala xenobiotica]|uniref:Cohesin loading factor n=1 Tax=Exophiala xenobiotica TaxID=348802 RepID=A0A0D2EPL7_9EURO|nr:uncharacterized protein PV05_05310 [Exophiala xenobiotica]KIW56670.1 hypothetical protein PV05_05310 [Exophiala xenobiotica]
MDPNYPFNPIYTNFHPSQYQRSSHAVPQQQQTLPYPQSQPHLQFEPQSQPQPRSYHHPQPYPPQNYSQFYYNQDQHYQAPVHEYSQQAFYLPPGPPVQPSQSRIQVVIPPHSSQSPSSPHQQFQQPRQTYHPPPTQPTQQPRNQVPSPAQTFQPPPRQQPPQYASQYKPDPPQRRSDVIVHIASPRMGADQSQLKREQTIPSIKIEESQKKWESPVPATKPQPPQKTPDQPLTTINPQMLQKTPLQTPSRVFQAVEINTKPKKVATTPAENRHSPVKPDEPEPNYPSVLCVLADDYLDAARKQPAVTEEYYNLIATALGCLESVLNNFKLPPLREAQVSLHYARILYEETENCDEAETRLTKSIELCERHKFIDLKYEMQLLLSKILYESNPKAALRDIQRMIDDIEAYRHTAWLYIFRFQHAMFSLASAAPGEVHSAAVQLEKITNLARQNSDSAVLALAAVLEALLHLSSSSHEAVTASQTALAKARALQLNSDVETTPQLTILMEFIDLACSVRECNIAQTESKRKIMHDVLYESIGNPEWREDGFIYIPVSKRAITGIQLQGNGHVVERCGKYFMTFSWLSKEHVEALGFLFSADSAAYKSGADGGKAEKFAEAGLAEVRSWGRPGLATGYQQSQRVHIFQKLLEAQFLFLICFMRCSRGSWQKASSMVSAIHRISEDVGNNFPLSMKSALLYLEGVILQGTGNTAQALEIYQSPMLSLEQKHSSPSTRPKADHQISTSYHADSDITRNMCILAAMNTAFILQDPQHAQHNRQAYLVNNLSTAVQSCGNKYIQAHYSLLVSVLSTTTLTAKQYLRSAMEAAKAIGSTQTTALALVYMQEKLFRGTVDEQAIKCARAASHQVRRWGDPMWMHVAAGLEAEALEINGLLGDAQQRRADAEASWDKLPEAVKRLKSD